MRKKLLLAAPAVALLTVTAACSSSSTASSSSSSAESAAPSTAESSMEASAAPSALSGTHDFSWGTFTLAESVVAKVASGEPINIVVQNQGTGIPIFGAQQKAGVTAACDEIQSTIKAECSLVGPVTTNQSQQLAELETLLTSGQVDCLGVQSPEPDAFANIIDKYIEAGIPVFTQNTDVPNSKRFAFYAVNEESAGMLNGQMTAQLLKDKGVTPNEVAMGSGNPQAPFAKGRTAGFIAGFKQVFPDAKFFNTDADTLPTGANFTTQEVIDSVGPFLSANPDVNVFFHTDQGVEGVSQIIKVKDLTDKVYTSGFNVSGPILDGVDAGRVLVTIDQDFGNQAGAVVRGCADFLATGSVPADPLAYLDPIVITKDGANGTMSAADARKKLAAAAG